MARFFKKLSEALTSTLNLIPVQELALGIHSALLYGHASVEVVSLLVNAGADVNQPAAKPDSLSPLGFSSFFGGPKT